MKSVSISMEKLFQKLNHNIEDMPLNKILSVKKQNIYLKAFDGKKVVKRKLFGIVKKTPSYEYQVFSKGKLLFSGSSAHRIWSNGKWIKLKNIKGKIKSINNNGEEVEVEVFLMKRKIPIVDVVMEGGNYFSNGVLSHNSGGNALKFYASVRLDMRRTKNEMKGEKLVLTHHKITVRKNKVGVPFRVVQVKIGENGFINEETI